MTPAFLLLRACERFGVNPYHPRGPEEWSAAEKAMVLAYCEIREGQDLDRFKAMARARR